MLVKVYDIFAPLPDKQLKRVLVAFNRCAAEVCEGQQWDMEFENVEGVTEGQYLEMIRLKTAVLLGFSLELGGILAGAPPKECNTLRSIGTNIGIGFQLKDDLLDAYADPKKFGKQVGGDIIANKKTYLLINARLLAKGTDKKELDRWLENKRFNKKDKINGVISIFNKLNIPTITQQKIDTYFNNAFKQLKKISSSSVNKKLLENFTRDLIDRQH
jgi:geranylgeranyl diphosphate synthase type II